MTVSPCPQCGMDSARILQEYDRVFPGSPVRVRRFQCTRCQSEFSRLRRHERATWDVEVKKLPKRRAFKCNAG